MLKMFIKYYIIPRFIHTSYMRLPCAYYCKVNCNLACCCTPVFDEAKAGMFYVFEVRRKHVPVHVPLGTRGLLLLARWRLEDNGHVVTRRTLLTRDRCLRRLEMCVFFFNSVWVCSKRGFQTDTRIGLQSEILSCE